MTQEGSPKAALDAFDQAPIPKEINYVWFGSNFKLFNKGMVRKCANPNDDHKITLWIDELSIVDAIFLQFGVKGKYHRGGAVAFFRGILTSNKATAIIMANSVVRQFTKFSQKADINVKFLGKDLYIPMLCDDDPLTDRFLRGIFLAIAAGNWGLASNLVRVQLLINHPGFYVDHDDLCPRLGYMTGFRYGMSGDHTPAHCFLAKAPQHPFLLKYRNHILDFHNNYVTVKFGSLRTENTVTGEFGELFDPFPVVQSSTDYDCVEIIGTQMEPSGPQGFADFVGQCMLGQVDLQIGVKTRRLLSFHRVPSKEKFWALPWRKDGQPDNVKCADYWNKRFAIDADMTDRWRVRYRDKMFSQLKSRRKCILGHCQPPALTASTTS